MCKALSLLVNVVFSVFAREYLHLANDAFDGFFFTFTQTGTYLEFSGYGSQHHKIRQKKDDQVKM